jgi:hypothetical protein
METFHLLAIREAIRFSSHLDWICLLSSQFKSKHASARLWSTKTRCEKTAGVGSAGDA